MPVDECQSTNHDHADCYGTRWTCSGCGKTFCSQEGADDEHFELCDDCCAKLEQQKQTKGR